MRRSEFNQLFPNADRRKFQQDYDGTMVFIDDNGIEEDIDFFVFWNDLSKVIFLNLSPLGWKWYRENPELFLAEWKRRNKFLRQGITDLEPLKAKNWGPQEWNKRSDRNTTPSKIVLNSSNNLNFEKFRIYVNLDQYFMFDGSLPNFGQVEQVNFKYPKNVYCLSLKAMYILSYLGGLSLKNLNSDNALASSLAHFYFYYHLQKFYNYRQFSRYNTSPVERQTWHLYHWKSRFVWYHPQVKYTPSELKRNDNDVIDHIHHMGNKVYYDIRLGKRSEKDLSQDYLKLLSKQSNGLTPLGQVLFQESCQAYVYCVLGAQAKTRWKIIGDGANSLQTQLVFQDLVRETIVQNDTAQLIKSMRIAVAATKVRLDFCISPGLELLPSDMVYIKDSPGYNNILLVSSDNQRFGVNNVNTQILQLEPLDTQVQSIKNTKPVGTTGFDTTGPPPQDINVESKAVSNGEIIVTSVFLAILGRLIWVLL